MVVEARLLPLLSRNFPVSSAGHQKTCVIVASRAGALVGGTCWTPHYPQRAHTHVTIVFSLSLFLSCNFTW